MDMDLASDVKRRAIKLLSAREHSRSELARKLRARDYSAELVDLVLDELEQTELLSEVRLIETYVAERLEHGFGPKRIRAELQAKGLLDAQIDPYLCFVDEQLLAQIELVHDRRFGAGSRKHPQTLAKRARFLEYRGFPVSLIRRYLDLDR